MRQSEWHHLQQCKSLQLRYILRMVCAKILRSNSASIDHDGRLVMEYGWINEAEFEHGVLAQIILRMYLS